MNKSTTKGMNVGSASLVLVFSVLCLTIFAVMSVVTAQNAWTLAEKSAQSITDYYAADTVAVDIFDTVVATYDGGFVLPEDCSATVEEIDGQTYLNYYVPIDDRQALWVQVYATQTAVEVSHWQVEETVVWTADQSLNVWGG
ncbi:hypothetical protein RFF05_16335 [Bengtsoniella intestinalis]|uniref:hypothetical protein n=1 Tax=Bengtsoniella intestinalis TaxID=3073143 RepID=UPI00391F09A8